MLSNRLFRSLVTSAAVLCAAQSAAAQVKISQVFGAGGNAGATYLSDYVELYNTGAPQSLAGWSLQYGSSTGTTWTVTALPSVTLGTGQYLLIKQADGTAAPAGQSLALPTPDGTGTAAMAADNFKLALVASTTAITGGTPTYAAVANLRDFVGTGTANWNDASANGVTHTTANNAPAGSTNLAVFRQLCGAQDTPNSFLDWGVGQPQPRNTATATNGGLSLVGMVHPFFAEEGQTVKIVVSAYLCAGGAASGSTTVRANLTSVGGSATQSLYDDGTNGDVVAGDGLYSFNVTVPVGTTTGTKSFQLVGVDGASSGGSTVGLEVKPTSTPDNDNCSTATAVAVPSTTTGNFTGATVEYNPLMTFATPLISFANHSTKRGLWYSITGTGNTVTASLCASTPSFDSVMFAAIGGCDALTVVATGDDNGPGCTTSTQASMSFCTELGRTYYIWISPYTSGALTNAFQLDITDSGTACTGAVTAATCAAPSGGTAEAEGRNGPSTNDGCDGIPTGATGRFQTITPATYPTYASVIGTARNYGTNRDIDWYIFQAATSDLFTAQLTSQFNGIVELRQLSATGTCGTNTLVVQSAIGARCGTVSVNTSITAGNWYALRVIPLSTPVSSGTFGGLALSATANTYKLETRIGGPPANDACANAANLAASISGNTAAATNDGTSTCDATGNDVWYTFTNTGSFAGNLSLSTCTTSIDTVISLFDACGGTELACNDDATGTPCSGPGSALVYSVAVGQTVKIRVSDKGTGGAFTLASTFVVPPPANDNCSGAVALAIPSATNVNYINATTDAASAPACTGPQPGQAQSFTIGIGVWYALTSPTAQTLTVDTLAGTADTKLFVYDGSAGCGALSCVTANDDIEGSPFRSKASFAAQAGVTYYVLLTPYSTTQANLTTVLTVSGDATPANDLCSAPEVLASASGSTSGTTVGATGINQSSSTGTNPSCAGSTAIFDVWYEYTAPCSGNYTFATCGSFDTVVSVHTGCMDATTANQLGTACNNDGATGCAPGSSLSTALVGGTTYKIRVAGYVGKNAGGAFTLTWSAPDTDGDGTNDCTDGCPSDPLKIAAGACGCGIADTDSDGDGVANCVDSCPNDPLKIYPGICGCGVADADTDGDGTADCNDGCPSDPLKVAAGQCGCGFAETDSDGDGSADCVDGCPNDPLKIIAGVCGCGIADTDTDGDGTADCNDLCPNDPLKIVAGACGCGIADTDTDGDGTADCNDLCPNDPLKIAAGQCGCGLADTDTDSDGTADCNDLCPNDPLKVAAGQCGCGIADTDTDSDGTADCNDGCPNDPLKTAGGICGCGVADTDSDGDGVANCNDLCPNDALKTAPGVCGCGVADTDTDGDGTADCNDLCPNDPNSTSPGACGCGVAVTDFNGNGTPDCNEAIVRISQVYGSGGNTQAPIFSDFIEIYNAGGQPQNLTGWSVQYTSATGTTWSVTALPAVTLAAKQYLLIQQGTGGTLPTGAVPANPTAQATGTIAMSGTDAKVALVASTTALSGGTPTYATSANLRDFVGLGTANWNESAAAGLGTYAAANNAPGMNTVLAVYRRLGGAKDSNVNKDDFAVGYPAPRNTTSTVGKGLAGIGVPFPLSVEETQVVRLLVTPFDVATNRPSAGLAVSADLTSIGGSATAALVDNGTSGDDLAGDGIFTLQTTVAAGTAAGTKNLPLSFVDAAGRTGGTFLNLLVAPTSTPDNDNCLGAQALTIGTPVSGTYTGALPESNPMATAATPTTSAHGTRRGLWFSVTGTGNTLTASTCGTTPAVDSVMAVYAGTCDGLTQIVGGDDNGPACGTSTNASASWCSQLGANYLIWIAPFSGGPQTSAYNLVVTDSGTPCATALPVNICTGVAGPYTEAEPGFGLATNDGCASSPNGFTDIATPGFPGVTIRGTGRGMVNSRDVDSYRFQATVTDTIQIVLNTLGTNAQAQLQKLSAGGVCPSTALTPAANTTLFVARCANGIQTVSAPVVAGDWYVINVITGVAVQQTPASTIFGGQMPGGKTYQYEMYVDIGAPPANNACANATALTTSPVVGNLQNATNDGASTCDATGKDVWYSFTAGADAGTLNLETCGSVAGDTVISVFSACGGSELACNDDNATCANPLAAKLAFAMAPNQSIRIRVSEKNTGAGAFTLTWTYVVPPPANDECATATVLASGSTSAVADTRFATPVTATAPASTCQSSQSRDIWFLWTSQGAGSVQVDTCGAAQPVSDSVITVYTGSCGSLTQVACDDDTCVTPNLASQATFTATCTTTYIIRVSQYGTSVPATAWTLNVTAPGYIDTDGDGSNDCVDGCPNDANKTAPGVCGCGVSDADSDGDGVANCIDGCPNDPLKVAPGICGCGVADTDSDGDGVANCNDLCPNDPLKVAPGACGCGVADTDSDGDGVANCNDGCPNDPAKIAPGACGCGVADTDSDGDGTADCIDGCPNDANKTSAGACGCGVADTDSDGDGTADCNDLCPNDPLKVAPGTCGCGVADTDTDSDGIADCNDNCDAIANPGQGDCDLDGVGDACELAAGTQIDTNANGTPDSCELGSVFTYCTAGTTTNGCTANINAVGSASASASAGFVIYGTGIEGQKQTLLYYGVSGPSAQVWSPGSSSFKCVRQPTQRVSPQSSGGTVDTCSGTYAVDLANYLSTRPTALGNPRYAGEVFNAQLWFRDPPAPSTSSMSNALQFTLAP